jgi:hypothetical protein
MSWDPHTQVTNRFLRPDEAVKYATEIKFETLRLLLTSYLL